MEFKLKQLIVILLIIFVSCGNVRSFDYIIESHGKREIIKSYPISKDKKYLNFILEGTFTDNLGNYGIWDNASIVTLQNNNVINLQGYGNLHIKIMNLFMLKVLEIDKNSKQV